MRPFLGDHGFLSRVTTLRVDLLVAIKIIRLEIFTSHQTGTSIRQVVMETKLTSRLYCTHFEINLQRILPKHDIKNRTVIPLGIDYIDKF